MNKSHCWSQCHSTYSKKNPQENTSPLIQMRNVCLWCQQHTLYTTSILPRVSGQVPSLLFSKGRLKPLFSLCHKKACSWTTNDTGQNSWPCARFAGQLTAVTTSTGLSCTVWLFLFLLCRAWAHMDFSHLSGSHVFLSARTPTHAKRLFATHTPLQADAVRNAG